MDLHTTSPGLSLSPGSPLDPAFLEDTLDEVRRHVDRANQELRFTVARLEMLHTERERLLEDARQLEEVVDAGRGVELLVDQGSIPENTYLSAAIVALDFPLAMAISTFMIFTLVALLYIGHRLFDLIKILQPIS